MEGAFKKFTEMPAKSSRPFIGYVTPVFHIAIIPAVFCCRIHSAKDTFRQNDCDFAGRFTQHVIGWNNLDILFEQSPEYGSF